MRDAKTYKRKKRIEAETGKREKRERNGSKDWRDKFGGNIEKERNDQTNQKIEKERAELKP